MNSTITIRTAKSTDLERLLQFEQGVIVAERPFDPTLREDPIHYYDIAAMIDDPTVAIMIGETKGIIIASGYARIMEAKSYLKHRQFAYLGFMYVDSAYRGRGVNGKIITALEQWIQAKGIAEIRLEVYAENDPAIKAYQKLGFTKHMIEMRKSL